MAQGSFSISPAPHPVLRSVWRRPVCSSEPVANLIEPDASCDFIFRFANEAGTVIFDSVSALFAGFDEISQPFTSEPGDFVYVGIQLQPWAASTLLRSPLQECVNHRIELRNLISSTYHKKLLDLALQIGSLSTGETLDAASGSIAALNGLEHSYDPLIDRMIHRLSNSPELDTIPDVADDHGYSLRTLERRCMQCTGLSPKSLLRIYRFLKAKRLSKDSASLADLALRSGFADQAHMTREFRRIVGRPPSNYFARPI